MKRYPREESENISEKNVLFLQFLKSVVFHEKSLRFASRMCSIGKHPRQPACGGLRGKNRGFRTLNDTVLRASLMQAQNMIDEMSDACYPGHYAFPPSTAFVYSRRTIFARCYLSYVKLISANLFIAYRINKLQFNVAQYRKRQPPVGFDRRLSEFLLDCYHARLLRYSSTF